MKCHKCQSNDLRSDVICNNCGEVVFFNESVLKWTKEKPMTVGFYWIRSLIENEQPVKVVLSEAEQLLVCFIQDSDPYSVSGLSGYEWYGPVVIPK
jgi:hypothetical protein